MDGKRIINVPYHRDPDKNTAFDGDVVTAKALRVVLGWAYRGLNCGFLLLQNFSVAISVSPNVCFILV